jgi:amino acid transporter
VLLYNGLGFELASSAGEEMKDPQRDVPRSVMITGALVAAVYALGTVRNAPVSTEAAIAATTQYPTQVRRFRMGRCCAISLAA